MTKKLFARALTAALFGAALSATALPALADIKESIQELRYYREAIFVPPPGPDSVRARQIAARYTTGAGPGTPPDGQQPGTQEHGAQEAAESGSAQ